MTTFIQISIKVSSFIPIWQDIEKAIVDIVKAGVYYIKKKIINLYKIIKSDILNYIKLIILMSISWIM